MIVVARALSLFLRSPSASTWRILASAPTIGALEQPVEALPGATKGFGRGPKAFPHSAKALYRATKAFTRIGKDRYRTKSVLRRPPKGEPRDTGFL